MAFNIEALDYITQNRNKKNQPVDRTKSAIGTNSFSGGSHENYLAAKLYWGRLKKVGRHRKPGRFQSCHRGSYRTGFTFTCK